MAQFDIDGARKAGYTDAEIQQFLLQSQGAQDAKKAGYGDDEILQHFGLGTPATSATPPAAQPTASAPGFLSQAGHLAGLVGGGLAQGAAAGLALPNTLQKLVDRGVQAGGNALGFNMPSQEDIDKVAYSGPIGAVNAAIQPPSVDATEGVVNALGMHGPEPQGVGERYLSAAAKGIGASLVPGGGGLGLTNAAIGAASGVGAQVGEDLMPDSVVAPIVGGLIGGGAIGAASSIGKGIGLGAAVKGAEEANTTAADQLQQLSQQRDQMSIAKAQMNLGQKQQLDTLNANAANVAEQTASGLGNSTTLQQSGKALQSAADDWMTTTFPAKKAAIWAPVDAAIPADTPAPLFAFKGALDNINQSAGSTQALTDLLTPALPRKLASAMENMDSPAGNFAKPPVMGESPILDASGKPLPKEVAPAQDAEPITWADARKLRTTIGDAMTNPVYIKDIGEQNLAHMYATLSQDLRSSAASVSPVAAQAFEQANAQTTALFDTARGPISSILNAKDGETAANTLINAGKKGSSTLQVLRGEMPDAVNEVGATALRSGKWQAMSPEAQEQMVPDAAARQMLNDSYGAIDNAQQAHGLAEQQHAQDLIDLNKQIAQSRVDQYASGKDLKSAQEAKAEQAAKWSAYGPLGLGVTGAGLGVVGHNVGTALGNPLGFQGAGALGTALGYGLPAAAMFMRNPDIRSPALQGAMRGGALGFPQKKQ